MKVKVWVQVFVVGFVLLSWGIARSAETDFPRVPGEVIVWLSPATTISQADALAQEHGLVVKRPMRTPGMFLMSLPVPQVSNEPVIMQEKLTSLRSDSRVRQVTLNYIAQLYQIPNDPLFGVGPNQQWNLFQIGLPGASGAWAIEKGRNGIIVAVLDTDYAVGHEDFFDAASQSRLMQGYNANNGGTNVEPPPGAVPGQYFSHGTMVASCIAAGTDNGVGMAGVTWEGVKVLPIRVMNDNFQLTFALIFDGYQFVIDWNNNPANTKIVAINMSYGYLGGPNPIDFSLTQQIANQGTLPIAAAGNSRPLAPAGWPASHPHVISVAATRYVSPALEKGFFASYSSQGLPDRSRKVDLAAPSADTAPVVSVRWPNGYTTGGGTSYACPTVVGAAALLASAGMDTSEIFDALKQTAVVAPGDPVPNVDTGWGEIDVAGALTLVRPGIRAIEPEAGAVFKYQTIPIKFRLFKIRTSGPAPLVTIQKSDGSFSATVDPSNYTLTTDPNNPNIVWLEGNVRLDDGSGSAQGRWKVIVEGMEIPPSTNTFREEREVEVQFHVIPAGLSMISIPYRLEGTGVPPEGRRPEDFFPSGFRLHRWVPSVDAFGNPVGSYALYDPSGPFDQDAGFKPASAEVVRRNTTGGEVTQHGPFGIGLWLRADAPSTLDFELGPEPNVLYYRIRLKKGWNQFGNPYEFPVDWSSCLIVRIPSGQIFSILSAADARIIRPQLFRFARLFDGSLGYLSAAPPLGQLLPFESHWVFAFEECWLQVPPLPSAGAAGLGRRGVRGEGWLMQLGVVSKDASDTGNYFGVTREVNRTLDLIPEPPSVPGGVMLFFRRDDEPLGLSQDLRTLSLGREVWRVTVVPNRPRAEMTLRWNEVMRPTKRIRLMLKDEATGRVVMMRPSGSYTFTVDEDLSPRHFTILAEPEAPGRLVIGSVSVSGGARGPAPTSYSIQYSLSRPAEVSVRILRADGRVVAEIDAGTRSAGTNTLVWNGRDSRGVAVAPGVYLLQITAETAEGERARTTTPINVIR
jgi:subtilisin family serine protease